MTDLWRVYYPEDGETTADARDLRPPPWKRLFDAEDAAEAACELDYNQRDGWERGMENRFHIVIICPKTGTETAWFGWSEMSVRHSVEPQEVSSYE